MNARDLLLASSTSSSTVAVRHRTGGSFVAATLRHRAGGTFSAVTVKHRTGGSFG